MGKSTANHMAPCLHHTRQLMLLSTLLLAPYHAAFEALFAQLGLTNKTFLAKENLESVKQVGVLLVKE